jgi:hypothetical protein
MVPASRVGRERAVEANGAVPECFGLLFRSYIDPLAIEARQSVVPAAGNASHGAHVCVVRARLHGVSPFVSIANYRAGLLVMAW